MSFIDGFVVGRPLEASFSPIEVFPGFKVALNIQKLSVVLDTKKLTVSLNVQKEKVGVDTQ